VTLGPPMGRRGKSNRETKRIGTNKKGDGPLVDKKIGGGHLILRKKTGWVRRRGGLKTEPLNTGEEFKSGWKYLMVHGKKVRTGREEFREKRKKKKNLLGGDLGHLPRRGQNRWG